ncbi:hypothetical protein HBI73_178420 [Parastagonospora nodorum]|nr:hypothetical protein HBH82_188300 [Parastagonospora nodorum]KAH4672190.1 hypothetical protein HBH78_176640 [Parastagonospora nodorum]KAH4696858.1 hypothetical protein HBH67_187570 [Parastagonospora nodorum]KAH4764322.1 hypothetical protein HBH63_187360 [Parastagonospora nodorum]KAH4773657.1 hypothetical protein HBH62_191670 [Parastagonospora nodorum]
MSEQQSKFDVMFAEGRKRYEQKTGQQLDVALFAQWTKVTDLRAYIDQENKKFANFREQDKKIYEQLTKTFTPVEKLGTIFAAGTSAGCPPAGACLGAATLLIKSAQNVSSHYGRIFDLFETLSLSYHHHMQAKHTSPELEENFANILATLLEMIGYSTKAITRRRWKEYFARLLQGDDQKIIELRRRLERLVRHGTSLVVEQIHTNVGTVVNHTAETAIRVDDIQKHTSKIGADIGNMNSLTHSIMDLIQKQHQTKCDNDVYDILLPSQTNTDKMERILRDRVAGTGCWLLSEPAFQSWLRRDRSLLCVCGSPGCGKTFLTSAFISPIQSNIANGLDGFRNSVVGFYFLSKNDAYTRIGGFHQALKDIAWQITRLNPSYADHVTSNCRSTTDIDTLPSAWRKLFVSYFGGQSKTPLYLVIDGLDEVEEDGEYGRSEFLKLLSDLQENSGLHISLLLLGRPHLTYSIKVAAYNLTSTMAMIQVEAHKTKEDLSKFVEEGISRRLQIDGASKELKSYIQSSIEDKAKGMFLWANLMLEILKWQTTENDIRDSLDTAPTGIDDMITEMLKVYSSMLKGREAEEFNTILAWLSCASRPLTLAEIDAALRRLSPSASPVLSLENKIRNTYATLIMLVRDDGQSTASIHAQVADMSLNSIPETTAVAFSHASIMEYFKRGAGKFAKRRTSTPLGVAKKEAEFEMLQTCLEIFVEPGSGTWSQSSQVLTPYVKDSWIDHIRGVLDAVDTADSTEKRSILTSLGGEKTANLIFEFLNDETIVSKWSHSVPWSIFTDVNAVSIVKCVGMVIKDDRANFPHQVLQWYSSVIEHPQRIFHIVAKIHAMESLHGDWFPLESLSVVAQIRALVEGDDTLETLSGDGKLSLDTISKAIHYIPVEPDARWHRNVAICYRRSGHTKQAIEHYEHALSLNHELVEARDGLALTYQARGYYTKAIDLELINTTILRNRMGMKTQASHNAANTREQLSFSYEIIANSYRLAKDETAALKYWREAVEAGAISDEKIREYLAALAKSTHSSRWEEVIKLLRLLDSSIDSGGQNRLTKYIHRKMWPNEVPPNFFYMAATAAKETDCLSWLITAYGSAIRDASTKSHMGILFLKLGLAKLLATYQHDYQAAEPLIEEIGGVASVPHEPRIPGLEDCKREVARDYCQIAIRKMLKAQECETDTGAYVRKVSDMIDSGITPEDLTERIRFREISLLHLAHMQHMTGALETARDTIRPYITRCCSMTREGGYFRDAGIQCLGQCLLALGRLEEALVLIEYADLLNGWFCDMCQHQVHAPQSPSICNHCFDFVCETYLGVLVTSPSRLRFCVPGHDLIHFASNKANTGTNQVIFRGATIELDAFIASIEAEWNVKSA